MAGDLTQQIERAAEWLKNQKWKLRVSNDFRPRVDIQTVDRFLVNVPRELLRGLVEHLVATATETTPQIEGKPYWGTWTFTRHRWERESPTDDNNLIFVQSMIAGAGGSNAFVVENGCAYLITQTFYWDVATLPSVPAGTSGIDYRIDNVSRDRESGLYNCVLEKREQITQTIALYVTEEGAAEQVKEQQFIGVRDGDKDNTGASIALQAMTLVAGFIKSRKRRKNPNCTQDIVEQSREGIDQTAASWDKSHAETVAETLATQSATTETEPLAPAAGTAVEVIQEPTLFGRMRKRMRTRTAHDQTATSWEKNHAEKVVESLATQSATTETEPTAPAAGIAIEVLQEPTLFGRMRKRLRTRTAQDQTATSWEKNHAEKVVETMATQSATTETEPQAPAAGIAVEVIQEPTLFGRMRKRLRTRTAQAQDTGWEAFTTEYGTSYTRRWSNQVAGFGEETVAQNMTAATSNSLSVGLNIFGREDGNASRIARKDDSASDAVTVSWVKRDLYYDRVKEDEEGATKTQRVKFEEHVKYEGTRASAESEAGTKCTSLGNVRDVNISRIQLATGRTKYRVVLLTAPISYGAWGTAPS